MKSTVSMYAPVLSGMSFSPTSNFFSNNETVAQRVFTTMKSIRTILTPIEYRLEQAQNEDRFSSTDKEAIIQICHFANKILEANLKDLFPIVDEALVCARTILAGKYHQQIEKWASTLMGSIFTINQIANSLLFDAAKNNMSCQANDNSGERRYSKQNVKIDDLIVCRICDEQVPVDLFEAHTESCIAAYQSSTKLHEVNQKIEDNISLIERELLDVEWPGVRTTTIELTIPVLQLFLILKRGLEADAYSNDSTDELATIQKALVYLKIPVLQQVINSSIMLLKEKYRQNIALTNAASVLRQTRLSGSDQVISRSNVFISDFEFLKRISAGAYARVFLGQKKKTGDLYAIKVLPKAEMNQKNQVKRALVERDILMQFNNPYIVNFYYSIIGKNNLYLVMEYLPGGDLYSLLDSIGSLDEECAKLYTREILDALEYLRENGIIHRDLKPDNVLVSQSGTLKLTDFGLSYLGAFDRHVALSDPTLASSSSCVGTPDFTAPEIILNKSHTFTADYWSLGVMLYEFLYGQPPFHGETEAETHTNILKAKINYKEMEEDGFSHEVIDLLQKLFVVDPRKRLGFGSIDEIINHPWFDGIDTKTSEPPFVPEIKSLTDTEYFQQRYTFKTEDDSDILEDIAESVKEKNSNISVQISRDMNKFQAVAVDQLKEKNSKEAEILRRKSMINPRPGRLINASMCISEANIEPPSYCLLNHERNQNYPINVNLNLDKTFAKKFAKSNSFCTSDVAPLFSSSSYIDDKENGTNNFNLQNHNQNVSPLLFQLSDDDNKDYEDEFESFPQVEFSLNRGIIDAFGPKHDPSHNYNKNENENKHDEHDNEEISAFPKMIHNYCYPNSDSNIINSNMESIIPISIKNTISSINTNENSNIRLDNISSGDVCIDMNIGHGQMRSDEILIDDQSGMVPLIMPVKRTTTKLGVVKSNSCSQIYLADCSHFGRRKNDENDIVKPKQPIHEVISLKNTEGYINIHNNGFQNDQQEFRKINNQHKTNFSSNLNLIPINQNQNNDMIRRRKSQMPTITPSNITVDKILSATPQELGFNAQNLKVSDLLIFDDTDDI